MPLTKPSIQIAGWGITRFFDSAVELLANDRAASELRLYFYAVTLSGWEKIEREVLTWATVVGDRPVRAYIGTDHALTDPDALESMEDAGIELYILRNYRGIFHPKVIWFVNNDVGTVLSGSNNLTEDGLSNNIEFAILANLNRPDRELVRWHDAIQAGSERSGPELIASYRREKEAFGRARANAGVAGTFTWSKRSTGIPHNQAVPAPQGLGQTAAGDLIMEVMPRETSSEGRQVQIPMGAAHDYFGLPRVIGSSINLTLENVGTAAVRSLRLTYNQNSTSRLSIRELEYRSRPCLLVFRRQGRRQFRFEIIRRAIDPVRFGDLLKRCPQQSPRRRWTTVS